MYSLSLILLACAGRTSVDPVRIPLGSLDSRSNPVREFGRAQDLQNVDIEKLGEITRRKGFIKRLDSTYGGPVRLIFAYGGLCGRFPQLVGGGRFITITEGDPPTFDAPGIYGEDPQPATPVETVAALSDLVVAQTNSVGIEWRYADGTKVSPWGAKYVLILRRDGTPPESPTDENATVVHRGLGFSATDTDKTAPGGTFYRGWVKYTSEFSAAKNARLLSGVWFVDASASAGGDGLTWGTAFQDPQDAVDAFGEGDQIWMTSGSYGLPGGVTTSVIDTQAKDMTGITSMDIYGAIPSGSLLVDDQDTANVVSTLDGRGGSSHTMSFTGVGLILSGVTLRGTGGSSNRNLNINTGSDAVITAPNCTFIGSGIRLSRISGSITSGTFEECTSSSIGGGIRADVSTGGRLAVTLCDFSGCAAGSGGAIFSQGCDITGCNFTDCESTTGTNGGAITASTGTNTIIACTFLRCTSAVDGGAIRVRTKTAIAGCSFTNCRAASDGGAIEIEDRNITARADVTIDECEFVSCSAGTGGAIVSEADAGAVITNSTFTGCEATSPTGRGGGIHDEGGTIGIGVTGSTFTSCAAGSDGGAMFLAAGSSTQSGNTFSGNTPNDVGP